MTEAIRFMRRPFMAVGRKVTEENMEDIARWCEGELIRTGRRTFIRVPVDRPTNRRQGEAVVGTWVLLSQPYGTDTWKVYTQENVDRMFIVAPPEVKDSVSSVADTVELKPVVEKEVRKTTPKPTPSTVLANTQGATA